MHTQRSSEVRRASLGRPPAPLPAGLRSLEGLLHFATGGVW